MGKGGEKVVAALSWKSVTLIVFITLIVVGAVISAFVIGAKYFSKSLSNNAAGGTSAGGEDNENLSWIGRLFELLNRAQNQTVNPDDNNAQNDNDKIIPPADNPAVNNSLNITEKIKICQNDSMSRGMTIIYYNLSVSDAECNSRMRTICNSTFGKELDAYFLLANLGCCEGRCKAINNSANASQCSDTDGNNNYAKGICTDASGTDTDTCPLGNFKNFVSESWCQNNTCMGASIPCPAGSLCYDGRCYTQAEDSDGDGFSDLDEYAAGTNPNDPNSKPNAFQCADSDGNDPATPGTCTDAEGQYSDSCLQGTMKEYVCNMTSNRCRISYHWCGTDMAYCSANRCVPISPLDCSGLCVLAGQMAAGGFCGQPVALAAWSPCNGLGGESGYYLNAPPGEACISNPAPFGYCCCYADAHD